MQLKFTSLTFLLFILLFSSCNQSKFQADKGVIIAGKILNFEMHKEVRSFRIYYQDFFDIQIIENVEINEDGSFQSLIPCNYKMDFVIRYEKISAFLICEPNDSIYITIDANVLNDSKNHYYSPFIKVVGGSRVDDNKLVNVFMKKTTEVASYSERREAIKMKKPLEYFAYRNELGIKKAIVLDSLLQTIDAKVMKSWSKDYLKYEKLNELMRYPRLHAKFNKISEDSLFIPDEYHENIFNNDINENEVLSMQHYYFLQSYYVYFYKLAKKEEANIVDYLINSGTGFSRDIALSKYYYGLIKKSDTINDINIDLIDNKYIKELLTQKIEIERKKKTELSKGKTSSGFIDSLFNTYKGKVVYVDFWGTWCTPCLKEMPYSKSLQEQFKNKPVEFLYLCNQSKKEDWQKIIKDKELTGTHLLLNDKQFTEFKDLFEIKGIPHYVIINKQGGFINNALRPSDKNIEKKLNQLLKE